MRKRSDEQGELIKGNTPTLLLAVIAEEPRHGYAIAREIERRTNASLKMGEGALYPALRALEGDGWIVSQWETAEGGPARKVYTITESGHQELMRRVRAWQQFSSAVDAVLGGFAQDIPPPEPQPS